FGITVLLGFLAGVYPSYFLASYKPARVLKGGDTKNNKSVFRSSLVVIQFGLAIAMIVSTLLVLQQFWFMQNKDIGFNKNQILLVDMNDEANNQFETLKDELNRDRNILGVTASGQRLGNNFHQWGFKIRTDSIRGLTPSNVNVDYDFLEVYEIRLKDGRGFSKAYAQDDGNSFVINESFAKEIDIENPVGVAAGHAWYPNDTLGSIVGVVEDFNFNSLHYEINTLAMVVHPDWGYDELSVKVDGKNVEAAIAHIEKTWNKLVPSWPFQYSFLDEHFDELYNSDQQMRSVIGIMALLAIFIACMGLFGLAAITTERKIKEIGIRKILGASVWEIMVHLSKNFALLILLAFLIFTPFTYWIMKAWLNNFAYHIDIQVWVFIVGGALAFVIALLTLSYHTFRSARANPVKALRHE
ncbi:MAG: FtsX-like permease family protein, partial [Bacteroidota bacterium]